MSENQPKLKQKDQEHLQYEIRKLGNFIPTI